MLDTAFWIAIIIIFFIIMTQEKEKNVLLHRILLRKKGREEDSVKELAKAFIDKDTILYLFNGTQLSGVVKNVTDGALLFESSGITEAVSLDFVMRIREHPKDKHGKKKSVVLD